MASAKWFEVEPVDDLGLSDQQSLTKYLENIFWIHSKARAASKGKHIDLKTSNLKNAEAIPIAASQFTEVVQDGVLPKLSEETSKKLAKKMKQIRDDFKSMKVENYSKLENRI